jgi:hypothetical protein
MAKPTRSLYQRFNARLFPWLGPPPLGPYDQPEPEAPAGRACPLCGRLMSEHVIDRSGPRTQLYCPGTDPATDPDTAA